MRFIFIYIALVLSNNSFGQDMYVFDKTTGEPIAFATIICDSSIMMTDFQGYVHVSMVDGIVEVRMLGYETETFESKELEELDYKVYLNQKGLSLDQIVVTATRIRQDRNELPYSYQTLDEEQRFLQNPQTTADLLGTGGKIFIQKSQQGGGSPMIRGFATNRLLYTVDGVRMNTAIFRGGNIQNVISLDPFAIEKTDIFFGPGSVIYGSDAIGGVMEFTTLAPTKSSAGKTSSGYRIAGRFASANLEKTLHADFNIGGSEWAWLTSVTATDYEDLRMGKHGPEDYLLHQFVERVANEDHIVSNPNARIQVPSGYGQLNVMNKLRFEPNDHWDFTFAHHLSSTTAFGRYDRHLRKRNDRPQYAEWDYGPQKWQMINLEVNYHNNLRWLDDMVIRIARQYFDESRISRNFDQNERLVQQENVSAQSINLDISKSLCKQKIYYGAEIVHNDVQSSGHIDDLISSRRRRGPSRYPNADWYSIGAYANYQKEMLSTLDFQAGFRYNLNTQDARFDPAFYALPFHQASTRHSAITGSTGAIFRPDNWTLSLNLSTGFRAPNVDDLGKIFDSEPNSVVVPNPNLKSEYAYSTELGVRRAIGKNIKAGMTGFYTWLENALTRRDFQLNGQDSILYLGELSRVQAIQNAAEAKVYGVQMSLEITLTNHISITTHYNMQKGTEELDNGAVDALRHAPPSFGSTRATWKGNLFKIQLSSTYCGEISFDEMPQSERNKPEIYAADHLGRPYSPAWYTIDLHATYQLSDQINLSAGIENITNQRYKTYSSGIAAAGINAIASIVLRV